MPLRFAVVGCGRMGKLHARVLSEMPQVELVGVADTSPAAAEALAAQRKCRAFTDASELVDLVDAAVVAAPTLHHIAVARPFVAAGKSVLIEKPLSDDLTAARELIELARGSRGVVQVGHAERFNPAVMAMRKYAIRPKFIESHRISPYTFRSTDVGVVLDVMIHDIDIVLMLAGTNEVRSVEAVGVNVIGDTEDIANARVTFANGCVANITASRLAMKTERKIRVFSRQAYLSLDFLKKEGTIIKADPNVDVVHWIQEQRNNPEADFAGVNWTELLHIENLSIENNEPLRVEQEAFLNAVRGTAARPEVTAEEGLAAMECAEKILASVREHTWE